MDDLEFLKQYESEPIKFFTNILDVDPAHVWSKMRQICESVRDHQFTCVKAGNSLSKSFSVARLALWFLYTRYPATVITTAPSNVQVEEILWREIRNAHQNARVKLDGKLLNTKLELAPDWFAYGFSTRADNVTNEATRFQGFHNENVLIIFDEAAGVHNAIWDAKERLLTTPRQKFIAIGNPTVATGRFIDCFKSAKFNKITISVKDTPNFKQAKEIIPGVSGVEFEQQQREEWGESSPQYRCNVLGEIPDADTDSLIPLPWIERAEDRVVNHNFRFVKKFITWDVADGGNDLQVIKSWFNTTEMDSVELAGKTVEEAEPYVWRALRSLGGNAIVVDCDGIGRVAFQLLQASADKMVTLIPFEGSSRDVKEPQTFYNRRDEAHWEMRNLFEKGHISIKRDQKLREELSNVKLDSSTLNSRRGYIRIEPKKLLKERIGRSPDKGDNVMMMAGCFDEVPIITKTDFSPRRILLPYDEAYCFNAMTV